MGVKDLIDKFNASSSPTASPSISRQTTGLAAATKKRGGAGGGAGYGFAFDIDGVLVRGKQPLPAAAAALRLLQDRAIPFILLTNGGGRTEADHAALVSDRLGLTIREPQFVQSHTPFRAVMHDADYYRGRWVLVLGGAGNAIKTVAAAYGLDEDRILSSSDLFRAQPAVHPFPEMTADQHNKHGTAAKFTADTPIAAVFVFSSPRDWCLDLQLCLDLVLSEKGVLGTRSPKNGDASLDNCGYQQDGQPALYFCNPDVEWATSYPTPRLAQGGFRQALEGVFAGVTKGHQASLRYWICGKPTPTTYGYAERALAQRSSSPLRTAYMIGDNPESDILGAITADENPHSSIKWRSVLVETGVHKPGTTPNHKPSAIKANVLEAVKWAIRHETGEEVSSP